MRKNRGTRRHVVIPDTQIAPGLALNHIAAAGRYIADKRPDVVIHLGDNWDMPSLNSYEKGEYHEGKRINLDIQAGNEAMRVLTKEIHRPRGYTPRLVLLRGNHEDRLDRLVRQDPKLRGVLSDATFESPGWQVVPFLEPITIDGIMYAHYFYAPLSGRAYGGTVQYKLGKIHHSFTQGHVQGLDVGRVELPGGKRLRGLVAGSFYQHDEEYKGPQANCHWRGILVKNEVQDGDYDLLEVSLDYLLRKWT